MSKVHFIRTSVIAALVLGAACRGAASQESEKAYFEGKTVRIVVGYAPGGGYDVYARMIAPYLKKYLDATVVVENKPGAGGITALNGLYASPPDGLRIMLVKGNAATMAQLTEQKGVRYDLRAFNILGGTGLSPDVMVVGAGSLIKSVEDLRTQNRTILWAATGPMDGLSDGAGMICEALKISCKVIMGYPSTNDAALALAKGEADAMLTNESSAHNFVKGGTVRALATMSHTPSRFFPATPTFFQTASLTADQRWWLEFRTNVDVFGRILVAPPGMSEARVSFLQAAVKQALEDPSLVSEGEKTLRYIEFQDPTSIRDSQKAVLDTVTDSEKQRILEIVSKTD